MNILTISFGAAAIGALIAALFTSGIPSLVFFFLVVVLICAAALASVLIP